MTRKFTTLLGKKPVSWKRLMALRALGDDQFESLTPAWPPAPLKRTFGGHVYSQAVCAASRTVGEGFVVHVGVEISKKCKLSDLEELINNLFFCRYSK